LTKYFGRVKAIEDVTFEAEKGEILGFLGPNAAGKTTTMRILTGYFPPSSGKARVAGYDIIDDSLEVRRRIGYLPENLPLYPDHPVYAYLDFVAEAKGIPHLEREKRREEVISTCNLGSVRNKLIGHLSRGYRQRVGIAQALINKPEVLVLDEPTVGLDPLQIIEIRNLIKSMKDKCTVILSTHILPEAEATCQRIILINQGNIIAVDTPENLSARVKLMDLIFVEIEGPQDEVIVELEKLHGVTGVQRHRVKGDLVTYRIEAKEGLDLRREIGPLVVEKGWNLLELRPQEVTLEEIFIKLVEEGGGEGQ
ncbi:MAG: ATP-binding cassette domain-containing protein, partial [Candidatus Eremiobacteraeota bacterium]|nr:ATP-binding cassette domain-containing protein [Candidatus Eremiobacteraeota bacterium]